MRKRHIAVIAGVMVGIAATPTVMKHVATKHAEFMEAWNQKAEYDGVSPRENFGDVLKHFQEDYYHRQFNEITASIKW